MGIVGARARRIVTARLRVGRDHENILPFEPEIGSQRALQTADQQSGGNQQHERDGDLSDHEHVPQACAGDAAAEQRALRREHGIQVEARGLQRRCEAEANSREERHRGAEPEHNRVWREAEINRRARNPRGPQSRQRHHHAQRSDAGEGRE